MEETDLITALIPAIKDQLKSKDTPYVKKTFERLIKLDDTDDEEAIKMLALCLADETNRMFIDKRNFDELRYQVMLNALPELPEA
ncbi:hypothetical protein [Rubritalea profundi]|uniref:Uncharacterized protein n=1 Tax=Rubritalea profundi TaxID=1658618 RepID=A0A2S7U3B9_9BACT|nr:hypothetical protein [Rubritalea profundi]PQJ29509.1 hypothetical protein BSZ32_14075 [Rubritalea profundi]